MTPVAEWTSSMWHSVTSSDATGGARRTVLALMIAGCVLAPCRAWSSDLATVDEVLAAFPDKVEEYRAGKDKLIGFFVGQVMKATQGKANPAQVNELLRRKLAG